MSHLRVLICRIEDETDEMTELTSLDLPSGFAHRSATPLDTLEAEVAQVGQRLLGRLCELAWEEMDAEAVARDGARQAPGRVTADGEATCGRPATLARSTCGARWSLTMMGGRM